MPFTLITLILIIMVLICFSIAIIWMVKQMKAPAPAQTHPLAFQLPAHSSRVWSQAEAMAAEASRVIAGDELAAQRRRAGKQPMGAPVGDPWELDGFEMPPIIMAEIRQSPIPMDEILLSSERAIFDRVQAERQQQQQQQQQPAPPQASATPRTGSRRDGSADDRFAAETDSGSGWPGQRLPADGMQLLRRLSREAEAAREMIGQSPLAQARAPWARGLGGLGA